MIYDNLTCPDCGSHDFRKDGRDKKTHKPMFECGVCGHKHNKGALVNRYRILILDIETLPILGYVWGAWDQSLSIDQIEKDWCILSWSAKWLYLTEVMGDILTPQEAIDRNDKRLMADIWRLLDMSDIAIAHNAKNFDIKKINSRLIVNGFKPPRFYRVIDTLQVVRSVFGFTMNKLDYINKVLGLDQKIKTDFNLWKSCGYGEKEALDNMLKYNKRDVECLEEAYLLLRPWIKSHPNIGLFNGDNKEVCASCGSEHITWDGGYYYTYVGKYSTYRCDDCGSLGRSRVTALSLTKRQSLLTSLAT